VIVALVAWLTGTPVARAADTTVIDPRRDVRANGLSDLERQAADIARVNATGGRFGVIVDVVFGGDADAWLGKGRLRAATVALVLHRRAGASIVVATRGPDADERTIRRARGAGVVRRRETFQFVALGVRLAGVRRVEIRVTVPGRTLDSASVPRPSSSDSRACAALARRIDDLRDELAVSVGSPDAERIVGLRGRVVDAWRNLGCRQEVVVFSSGYEHRPGAAAVCADAELVPDLGEPVAFELYSYDVKVAEGESTPGLDGTQRLHSTVTAEGRYRLEIFKVDEPEIATSVELDVVAPPPVLTKSCA